MWSLGKLNNIYLYSKIIFFLLHPGCILGEMLLTKPLFQGTSTFNQLERILQHIPTPTQADVASISSQYGPSVLERAGSG